MKVSIIILTFGILSFQQQAMVQKGIVYLQNNLKDHAVGYHITSTINGNDPEINGNYQNNTMVLVGQLQPSEKKRIASLMQSDEKDLWGPATFLLWRLSEKAGMQFTIDQLFPNKQQLTVSVIPDEQGQIVRIE